MISDAKILIFSESRTFCLTFFTQKKTARRLTKIRRMPFAEKNSLFLKKSSVRFFQKQAVFFREEFHP